MEKRKVRLSIRPFKKLFRFEIYINGECKYYGNEFTYNDCLGFSLQYLRDNAYNIIPLST